MSNINVNENNINFAHSSWTIPHCFCMRPTKNAISHETNSVFLFTLQPKTQTKCTAYRQDYRTKVGVYTNGTPVQRLT